MRVGKTFLDKPVLEFINRVMRLITWGVPVEIVADAQGPIGVVGEVEDFIKRAVEDWNASQDAEGDGELFEDASGQARRQGAQSGVEPFLRKGVAAIKPNGQAPPGATRVAISAKARRGLGP